MIKTVIFVEGQTELIVTREFLLKYFEYNDIEIVCYRLVTDSNTEKAEYDFQNNAASYHFQIINVGNDKSVLSAILKREKYLVKNEYKKIIGLRDMYSKEYKELSVDIKENINTRFVEQTNQIISNFNSSIEINFHFAIMEIEAWLLGINNIFEKFDNRLSNKYIENNLSFDLQIVDPEKLFYHPAKEIDKILGLIGIKYNKSKAIIESLINLIGKNEIQELAQSTKCNSFKNFWQDIVPKV
jgi:hypothetical protein